MGKSTRNCHFQWQSVSLPEGTPELLGVTTHHNLILGWLCLLISPNFDGFRKRSKSIYTFWWLFPLAHWFKDKEPGSFIISNHPVGLRPIHIKWTSNPDMICWILSYWRMLMLGIHIWFVDVCWNMLKLDWNLELLPWPPPKMTKWMLYHLPPSLVYWHPSQSNIPVNLWVA